MAKVLDVGQYVTEIVSNLDKIKLYKLCYFAHGWHVAWTGKPLFREELQAWVYGPVSPLLRKKTEPIAEPGPRPIISHVPGGDSRALTSYEKAVIESIVTFYATDASFDLSDLNPSNTPATEIISTTSLLHEFTLTLKNKGAQPKAPRLVFDDDWANKLESAADNVERRWRDTLSILADC
ncbi:uncharacterized phage-associated protein [Corynebacterium renale]|uniref:Panacea domain-containing protein n=1 Tax=Corynebacterium renale TaxID=1724 RepID=UPI000DA3484A|nr:Panacea domain-containing protein [Corynebacterium renale]SQG64108.1 uncharacterized phage-associated protein [Corynebacterium renale]STC94343.1 uncharacterized phage-associated protein [Corynebacterium renale]